MTGASRERRLDAPAGAEAPVFEPFLLVIEAFADAAAGRAPYPVPHDQMIANVSALEAVFRSAASGTVQTVEN